MDDWAPLAATLGLLALGLGAGWWRSRSRIERLRKALSAKSTDLENLQLAFSRFAPQEVVERIIDGGVTSSGERKEVTALLPTWLASRRSARPPSQ